MRRGNATVQQSDWASTLRSSEPQLPHYGPNALPDWPHRIVPVTANGQPGLALEEVPRRPVAGAQHRPAHEDHVRDVVRQSEAVEVLPRMNFLVLDQERVLAQHLVPGAGCRNHVADRERACNGEFEPVMLSEKQAARAALDLGTADLRYCEPDNSTEIDEVATEANPLSAGFRPTTHGLNRGSPSWGS